VLPAAERERAAAAAHIGFGNVIKILLRFETAWWLDQRRDLVDLTFLSSDARIPVWWTQHPINFPVLTVNHNTCLLSSKKAKSTARLSQQGPQRRGDADAFGLDVRLWRCQSCKQVFAKVAIVL
jgi:hypothetical protein